MLVECHYVNDLMYTPIFISNYKHICMFNEKYVLAFCFYCIVQGHLVVKY